MADQFQYLSPPLAASDLPSTSPTPERKSQQPPRVRRRNRLITSCLECRRRKLKCDKQQPCSNCTKISRDCIFIAPALDPVGQARLAEVKEKMGMLERTLEEDVARRRSPSVKTGSLSRSVSLPEEELESAEESAPEDERDLEPDPLAVEDAAYYDDADDDLVDLGIQLGKMRITERVGGYVRPRFTEQLTEALKEVPPQEEENPNTYGVRPGGAHLSPGKEYIAPSSSFYFAPGIQRTSLMQYLPSKALADKFVEHYWLAVHVIARAVHRPSFERKHENFWNEIGKGIEPPVSFQAVVFAVLLSAAISMSDEEILADFGVAKSSLVENFKQGTEAALARANFLRTTKLETLQAFVIYLIPLCRAEVSRAHSALTGTAIRLAECMGLHRDGSHFGLSPIEIHVRRLIWFQLCFLDLRTCEATGPRPQIRHDDYDTRFPLNVDDADLDAAFAPTQDAAHFTDMTITRMRFECYEMHRLIWVERPRIEKKKTTLTHLLSKIQTFCSTMEKTYLPMLDKKIPLHFLATQIYTMLSTRMHIMILNKYASNQHQLMPERLRQMMIGSGVLLLESAMTIETTPALKPWTWYHGALHQYHTALLMLSELYAKPREPAQEARVWRCLDFAFELPSTLSQAEKSRIILGELRDRTEMYQRIRRVRAPADMKAPLPRKAGYEYRRQEEARKQQEARRKSGSASVRSDFASPSPLGRTGQLGDGGQHPLMASFPQVDYSYTAAPGTATMGAEGSAFTFARGPGMSPAAGFSPPLGGSESSGSIAAFGGAGAGAGGSPGNAEMLDIDWNEWDRLFPPDASSAGGIMIPPFTFPQFSPTELQWTDQGQV